MRINEVNVSKYDTLLLDRDGTINVHIVGGYVRDWSEFEFVPDVLETISRWSACVKHIFIVTNQRGIGRGKLTEANLTEIHTHMLLEIERAGGRIDGIYYCTSLTEEDIRRKPGRGMFDDIIREHPDVDPTKTLMIGDGDVDRDFAKNSGIDFQRIDSLKLEGGNKFWVLA